jgi:hypothetical protein
VSDSVAFDPDSIAVADVLSEQNATMRRPLLERMGAERSLREARATILDADQDRGGPRRRLRVPVDGGQDLAFVEVRCPLTGQTYLLRVPPRVRTCREAVAWTAGFEDSCDYRPEIET